MCFTTLINFLKIDTETSDEVSKLCGEGLLLKVSFSFIDNTLHHLSVLAFKFATAIHSSGIGDHHF